MAEQHAGPEVSAAPGLLWFGASGFKCHNTSVCMVGCLIRLSWSGWHGTCCAWGPSMEASCFSSLLSHTHRFRRH